MSPFVIAMAIRRVFLEVIVIAFPPLSLEAKTSHILPVAGNHMAALVTCHQVSYKLPPIGDKTQVTILFSPLPPNADIAIMIANDAKIANKYQAIERLGGLPYDYCIRALVENVAVPDCRIYARGYGGSCRTAQLYPAVGKLIELQSASSHQRMMRLEEDCTEGEVSNLSYVLRTIYNADRELLSSILKNKIRASKSSNAISRYNRILGMVTPIIP